MAAMPPAAAVEWNCSDSVQKKFTENLTDSTLSSYTTSATVCPSNLVDSVRSPLLPGVSSFQEEKVKVYGSNFDRQLSQEWCNDSPREAAGVSKCFQEEGNDNGSVVVHLNGKNSPSEKFIKQSIGSRSGCVKCKKRLKSFCFFFSVIMVSVVFWCGFVCIETFPRVYVQESVLLKNTIVLLTHADPLWYSSVTVRKYSDQQDHLLKAYTMKCSELIMDNNILKYNRTLVIDRNVPLLNPTFMIEGTVFDFTIESLGDFSNFDDWYSSIVISNNADTLSDFETNRTLKSSDVVVVHNVSSRVDRYSFTLAETGIVYVGLKLPAPKMTQFRVAYDVLGYKYVRPTLAYSTCSTQQSGSSCTVALPSSLANLDSDYYCVLGEVDSNPSWDDQNKLQVSLKVHRGWWNMFTIAVFLVCVIATSCGTILHLVCCIRFLRQKCYGRISNGYLSIQ